MKKNHSNLGFTLVELMIAIALFTIIVGIAVGGFTNALRTQRQVSSLIATQSNVGLAIEQMTREVRTGYLFCHDVDSGVPNGSCGTCIINPDSSWTCDALDYYTADGSHVNYAAVNGGLIRTITTYDANGNPVVDSESITGDNVNVQKLHFVLFGNIEGDNWTPRVTIAIGVSPNSNDEATKNDIFYLQTSVSARQIDCTSASGSLQC